MTFTEAQWARSVTTGPNGRAAWPPRITPTAPSTRKSAGGDSDHSPTISVTRSISALRWTVIRGERLTQAGTREHAAHVHESALTHQVAAEGPRRRMQPQVIGLGWNSGGKLSGERRP